MLNSVLSTGVKSLLALRYRVRLHGLEQIARRGTHGILFLPNHPALIDPIILMAWLQPHFQPRALADQEQIDRPVIAWLSRRINVIPIPDIKVHGLAVRGEVEAARQACVDTLRSGGNVLLYPSGHIYRTRYEDLRGNSGAADVLCDVPDARVVVVRTRGLWGSSFSLASGEFPNVARVLRRQLTNLLKSYLFFMPRREVNIELSEPADLPRDCDRHRLNAYLERWYNADAPPSTQVSYVFGSAPRQRVLPEPQWGGGPAALAGVPATTRQRIIEHLRELTGIDQIRPEHRLAQDLGLDSLSRAELLVWLGREFGCSGQDGDMAGTVGDLMLAACGEAIVTRPMPLARPPARWFRGSHEKLLRAPPGETVAAAFLAAARSHSGRLIIADQISGGRTYRDLVTAIMALKPQIERLGGERIGIMLPASVAASVAYWATLFAGKVPVMVNWTTGARNVLHALDVAEVGEILTSAALVTRLESQGTGLDALKPRLLMLEELRRRLSTPARLRAKARSYLSWAALEQAPVRDTAAILMTSGSESMPKVVPLLHTNLLTNIRDVLEIIEVREDDRLLGFLPPFHSFGLTVTLVATVAIGLRTAYHANPTEATTLARMIEAYRVTILVGTPTFLSGILRAATGPRQLATLRLAITGAEKCPIETYQAFARQCPRAVVLEGYGITECSPIVAANRVDDPRPGTVGKVMPSLEYTLVDVDSGEPVARGRQGMLLVRGPSVFSGYLGPDVSSPFVEHGGKSWYRTGDLLSEDADGVLTFQGRLKRFVKLGGEMVSLPAIEAALAPYYSGGDEEGPTIAVEAAPDQDRPEIVLFTTRATERQAVNQQIRAGGLSPLHNVSRVIQVDEIPLLGNGKTDYRSLRARLSGQG